MSEVIYMVVRCDCRPENEEVTLGVFKVSDTLYQMPPDMRCCYCLAEPGIVVSLDQAIAQDATPSG